MAEYAVTFDDVVSSAARLRAAGDELGADLRQLSTAVGEVVHREWRGAAAAGFEDVWHGWHAAATAAVAAIHALADVLAVTGSAYATTDDSVRRAAAP